MNRFLKIAILVATLGAATTAWAADLQGNWSELDNSGAARIAPCSNDASALCATIIRDTPQKGARSTVGQIILSDLKPAGKDRWRGAYHDGATRRAATVRLIPGDRAEMKVCVGLFCAKEIYVRERQ